MPHPIWTLLGTNSKSRLVHTDRGANDRCSPRKGHLSDPHRSNWARRALPPVAASLNPAHRARQSEKKYRHDYPYWNAGHLPGRSRQDCAIDRSSAHKKPLIPMTGASAAMRASGR